MDISREKVLVQLLFFAKAKELVGKSCDSIALPTNSTLKTLIDCLVEHYPPLQSVRGSFIIALNQTYISSNEEVVTLKAGDEVAIIPPISGG